MFDREQAIEQLQQRQSVRKLAFLPALDIEKELAFLEKQAITEGRTKAFQDWVAANPDIVSEVREDVKNGLRQNWSKPADWEPSGQLSGGGMWFELEVREVLLQRYNAR